MRFSQNYAPAITRVTGEVSFQLFWIHAGYRWASMERFCFAGCFVIVIVAQLHTKATIPRKCFVNKKKVEENVEFVVCQYLVFGMLGIIIHY